MRILIVQLFCLTLFCCCFLSATALSAPEPTTTTRREYFGSTLQVVATASSVLLASGAAAPAAHADVTTDLARIKQQERLQKLQQQLDQTGGTVGATVSPMMNKLRQAFPGALPNKVMLERVGTRLLPYGFRQETTLVASSLCSDEVNRPLEEAIRASYGDRYFAMGGLAGFPFSGVTGFGAMASHIPDSGNCLLIYGPHVGVDSAGNVGKVDRRGKLASGTCCGSAVYASKTLLPVVTGEEDISGGFSAKSIDMDDAQQKFVTRYLLPYSSEICSAKEPMVSLPYVTFKPIDNMMNEIVAKASAKVGETGKIAMLGGLQINTPGDTSDYFLPLRFEVRDSSNKLVSDDNLLLEMYTGLRTAAGVRPDIDTTTTTT